MPATAETAAALIAKLLDPAYETTGSYFDAALGAIERILDDESDFARASRLQAIIIELAILRHTR
jgi:hypothetical protein